MRSRYAPYASSSSFASFAAVALAVSVVLAAPLAHVSAADRLEASDKGGGEIPSVVTGIAESFGLTFAPAIDTVPLDEVEMERGTGKGRDGRDGEDDGEGDEGNEEFGAGFQRRPRARPQSDFIKNSDEEGREENARRSGRSRQSSDSERVDRAEDRSERADSAHEAPTDRRSTLQRSQRAQNSQTPGERFRRPTIEFRARQDQFEDQAEGRTGKKPGKSGKHEKAEPPEPEKFLYPSLKFKEELYPWALQVGDVTLLQDSYASLKRKHPDCRRIESSWENYAGRIACSDTRRFRAEGDQVIFSYAKVNDVLTGASYVFSSEQRAQRFAGQIRETLAAAGRPSFTVTSDTESELPGTLDSSGNPPKIPQVGMPPKEERNGEEGASRLLLPLPVHLSPTLPASPASLASPSSPIRPEANVTSGQSITDSPMFTISVLPSPSRSGWIVNVDAHFQDRLEDIEVYAKHRLQQIEFGNLTIGSTRVDKLPELPKSCTEVSRDSHDDMREFYGLCFEYPYEAHIQLNFNQATGILETAVLSPIGASTGAITEDILVKRFGHPAFCRRITTDTELLAIKTNRSRGRQRIVRMKSRPAQVYAGTCENPVIYSSEMRYIFENRHLNGDDIMTDYLRRERMSTRAEEHIEAADERQRKMKGFFE